MSAFECPREPDVFDEIEAGRWPEQTVDELRMHVAACAVCRDLVDVVPLLREAGELTRAEVTPPPKIAWLHWSRSSHRAAPPRRHRPATGRGDPHRHSG